MPTFSRLGDALKAMYNKLAGKADPNLAAIAAAIDNIHRSAQGLVEVFQEHDALFTQLAEAHSAGRHKSTTDPKVIAVSDRYSKQLGLRPKALFTSIQQTAALIQADAKALDKSFLKVFGDLKTVDDVRVSHAYVFGYLTLADLTLTFYKRLLYMYMLGDSERPPAYIIKALQDDVERVIGFVQSLTTVRAPGRRTILTDLEAVQKGGNNVFINVDGQTLDQYAQAKDYLPQVAETLVQGFALNPSVWVINGLLALQRWRYERNVKMREWLVTKVAILEMELAGQTDSAEYQKKQQVLAAYTKMIATLDKKIADYENS